MSRRLGVLALIVVAAVALVTVAAVAFIEHRSLTFSVRFRDASGITPGAWVVSRGVEIGAVQDVRLYPDHVRVEVRVTRGAAATIGMDHRFTIETSAREGEGHRPWLLVRPPVEETAFRPIARDALLMGQDSVATMAEGLIARGMRSMNRWFGEMETAARELEAGLQRGREAAPSSPPIERHMQQLRDAMDRLQEADQQGDPALREQARREAAAALEQMREELGEQEANATARSVEALIARFEQLLQD